MKKTNPNYPTTITTIDPDPLIDSRRRQLITQLIGAGFPISDLVYVRWVLYNDLDFPYATISSTKDLPFYNHYFKD